MSSPAPQFRFNPITGQLDLSDDHGTGPGGNIDITADEGGTISAQVFSMLGKMAGSANVMTTLLEAGILNWENRAWETQYVVDASATPGLRGSFQTIQAAMDAAVLDGASLTNQKMIYIRYGTYVENLNIPPGIFLKGDAMWGQPGALPLFTTIQGNHTVQPTNLFRAQGLYFTNVDGTLDMFTNGGSIVLFNFYNCVFNNGNSTGLILTSDFNYNQFNYCIFYGNAQQDCIALNGGMITMNFCQFPQGSGIANGGALRLYDCNNVGLITNNNGQVFAYNCQFNGGDYCVVGTGASNLFHGCEFSASIAGVNTPSVVCSLVDCYLTPGAGASLATASTLYGTIVSQAGNVWTHVDINSSYTASPEDVVINVDSSGGAVTVTFLPTGPIDQFYIVKDVAGSASTNNITVQIQTGNTIDDAANYVLANDYQAVAFHRYDGSNMAVLWDAKSPAPNSGTPFNISRYNTAGDALEASGWLVNANGQMVGPNIGSASLPDFTLANNTNGLKTGFYYPQTGQFAFSSAGVEAGTFDGIALQWLAQVRSYVTDTNANNPVLTFIQQHALSSGTPANGIGCRFRTNLPDDGSNMRTAGDIVTEYQEVATATRKGRYRFFCDSAGSLTETFNTGLYQAQFFRGIAVKRTATAISYSVLVNDYLIAVTDTSAVRTITLPNPGATGMVAGQEFVIKDESMGAATNNISVVATGANIDGLSSASIGSNGGSLTIYSNGTNYFIR